MSIFDRVKGVFGRGGSADYIGDLADDSWGEVPVASPSTYLTSEPRRAIDDRLPRFEDDWEGMLRQARVREEREEHLIRVPVSVIDPMPASTPDTDWDALLAQAKSRAEASSAPLPTRAPAPGRAPAPAPVPAKASFEPHPTVSPPPSKFAMGTMPPASSSRPAASTSRASAFLPAPRPTKRDDEWETVIARAKMRTQAGSPNEQVDPWEDAIKKAKTRGAA